MHIFLLLKKFWQILRLSLGIIGVVNEPIF